MTYSVELSENPEKYLLGCPGKMRQHLLGQLTVLEDSPRERGRMLRGEFRGLFRIKLYHNGTQYRAIYEIYDDEITVLVLLIHKREEVYEKLKRMKISKDSLANSRNKTQKH